MDRSCDTGAPGEFAAMMRERQLAIKAREARCQRHFQKEAAAADRRAIRWGLRLPPLLMAEEEFDSPYELNAAPSPEQLVDSEVSTVATSSPALSISLPTFSLVVLILVIFY